MNKHDCRARQTDIQKLEENKKDSAKQSNWKGRLFVAEFGKCGKTREFVEFSTFFTLCNKYGQIEKADNSCQRASNKQHQLHLYCRSFVCVR